MTVRALSSSSVTLPVSGMWDILVEVRDADHYLVDAVPVVTVTLPAGSTSVPAVETITTGVYRSSLVLTSTGRYVARVVTSENGAVDLTAFVQATVAATGMPAVEDVSDYLGGDDTHSWEDDELQDALDAEAAAQRARCRVGAAYPADLRQALLRRVARNLALRGLPIAVLQGDAEGGPTVLPGSDPEVRRLEAPYRKRVVG